MENLIAKKKCHCCKEGNYKQYVCADTYKCDNCGHIYRHYKGDISSFHKGDVYRDGQFDKDMQAFKQLTPQQRSTRSVRCKKQLSVVRDFANDDDSLIDLATGKGFFLEEAKVYFKNLKATDIHRVVQRHNAITNPEVEIILCDILDMDENSNYDIVTAFDVLEHVDDIDKFIKKAYKICNKYCVVQVPCDRPMSPPNIKFDGHAHYFNENSLQDAFCKDGLFSAKKIKKYGPGQVAGGAEIIGVFLKVN